MTLPIAVKRLLLLVAVVCGCSRPDAAPAIEAQPSIVGTWRVVAHHPRSGSATYSGLSLGERPRGYLVYDGTGHIFLQIQRRGAADSIRNRSWRDAPDSVLEATLDGFRAYFGTYTVDGTAGVVTHRIEGEFLPRGGEWEVATPYRLSPDSLWLGADSLERWVFARVR